MSDRPNILFVAVDDLRDYVGCLHGHPAVQTPNLDRLAGRGTLFANAHCQVPACAPSRASMLTGSLPCETGCYGFQPHWHIPAMANLTTLPAWLRAQGYATYGTGKIHHGSVAEGGHGPREHEWDAYWPSIETPCDMWNGDPDTADPRYWQISGKFSGGPSAVREQDCGDHRSAKWAAGKIGAANENKPFFLACGFYRPHLPFICPQKYFDLYDPDDLPMPIVRDDDLADVPEAGRAFVFYELDATIRSRRLQRQILHSYLACVSYMDAQLGILLDALDASGQAGNTMVILCGDNGWHFGEKRTWKKFTLWREATRVPLCISGPGISSGGTCRRPVGLVDIYPTIVEALGADPLAQLRGNSLWPLLRNPDQPWDHPVLTTFGRDNHAITTEQWKYIHYFNGDEELYDLAQDPREWSNLAVTDDVSTILRSFRGQLPTSSMANAAGSTLSMFFDRDYPDLLQRRRDYGKWSESVSPDMRPW